MSKITWRSVGRFIGNKYLLIVVLFAVLIIFFDQHNLLDRIQTRKHLEQLQQDTLFYRQKIREEREMIRELQTSPANLEKFAREQYLMKAPDEDIFIILKDRNAK